MRGHLSPTKAESIVTGSGRFMGRNYTVGFNGNVYQSLPDFLSQTVKLEGGGSLKLSQAKQLVKLMKQDYLRPQLRRHVFDAKTLLENSWDRLKPRKRGQKIGLIRQAVFDDLLKIHDRIDQLGVSEKQIARAFVRHTTKLPVTTHHLSKLAQVRSAIGSFGSPKGIQTIDAFCDFFKTSPQSFGRQLAKV
jgi:two-component SAPR family response regulator